MKVLVVGVGSIGRRHAGNAASVAEVGVFDTDTACATAIGKDLGTRTFDSFDAALAWSPDAAVVATPPASHLPVASRLLECCQSVMIEKPISHRLDGIEAFLDRADRLRRPVHVVCNMRFHPGPATLREQLESIGDPLFARAYYGHDLEVMRPGTDYRTLYCAHGSQGGGVALDGVHELDYLGWMLGPVISGSGTIGRLSNLEIDAEDYAVFAFVHAGGARSEIHLDYIRRPKRRGRTRSSSWA